MRYLACLLLLCCGCALRLRQHSTVEFIFLQPDKTQEVTATEDQFEIKTVSDPDPVDEGTE